MSKLGEWKNGKTPFKAKRTTKVTSKSKKLEVELSPELLEILSVKKHNGQIKIEYRAPSTSAPSIVGTDHETPTTNQAVQDKFAEIKVENEFGEPSISVQSIPPSDAERHNYSTAIKVEAEVDIKMEDEMEFCALSTAIPGTYDGNQSIQYEFAEIKVNQIEFEERNISLKSISTAVDDEFSEIEDEMEFCDEVEMDPLNTPETTVPDKPVDEPDVNKKKSEFTCDICSKKLTRKSSLRIHRLLHGKPNFHCTVCAAAKFTQYEFNLHMRTHDTTLMYSCNICSKKFTTNGHLNHHRKRHGKPNFNCNVCDVAKFTQSELTDHMNAHHTNKNHFTCDICSKKFPRNSSLVTHRLRHGKPNFHCTVCDDAKFTQFELDLHMSIHDTKRMYSCDICSKNFRNKPNLAAHQRRHGKPKFNCNVCDVAKYTSTELTYHMTAHHTNKNNFTCDICSKKYSRELTLARHQLLHDKPKFFCKYCGLAKYTNYDLNRHMKVHKTKQD